MPDASRERDVSRDLIAGAWHANQTIHEFAAGCPANFIPVPPSPLSSVFYFPSELLYDDVRVLQPQGPTPRQQGVRFRPAQGKGRLDRERRFPMVSRGLGGRSDTEPAVPSGFTPQYKGKPLSSAPGISGTLTPVIK